MPDNTDQLKRSALDLTRRLREVVSEREDSLQWFRAWGPVVSATSRLASTLSRVAVRLAAVALEGEDGAEILTASDRAVIAGDLQALAEDFPDIADVLFGLHHVDRLTEAMLHDDVARRGAARVTGLLGKMIEGLVSRLVDVAMGNSDTDFGPERIIAFLERFEGVAQELIDRWVPHGLGMMSSAVAEETDDEEDA